MTGEWLSMSVQATTHTAHRCRGICDGAGDMEPLAFGPRIRTAIPSRLHTAKALTGTRRYYQSVDSHPSPEIVSWEMSLFPCLHLNLSTGVCNRLSSSRYHGAVWR